MAGLYLVKEQQRKVQAPDAMEGAYLGPAYSDEEIFKTLKKLKAVATLVEDENVLMERAAGALDKGLVVGWFQGRMEFGPRALGNRSILGDARNPEMQKKLNLKIKYRESFRPFAPSTLEEDVADYYDLQQPSPYMLLVGDVVEARRNKLPASYHEMLPMERLYIERSDVPAITHIDFSARVQTVNKKTNLRYWKLIDRFKAITGHGTIINTSFNVRGEPIVRTPEEGYSCFMNTEMDVLVMGNYILLKEDQPAWDKQKHLAGIKPD
jgi:carbamoyltransferase